MGQLKAFCSYKNEIFFLYNFLGNPITAIAFMAKILYNVIHEIYPELAGGFFVVS